MEEDLKKFMKEEVSKKVGFRNNIIKDDKATKRI